MTEINDPNDITKLSAYLRIRAKGKFVFDAGLLREVIDELKSHAKQFNVDISLETVDESGTEILLFTSGGALIGAIVGYLFAYIPGAVIGGLVGATVGTLIAGIHCTLTHKNEKMVLEIA